MSEWSDINTAMDAVAQVGRDDGGPQPDPRDEPNIASQAFLDAVDRGAEALGYGKGGKWTFTTVEPNGLSHREPASPRGLTLRILDAIGYQTLVEEHRLGLTDEQWLERVRAATGRADDAEAERDAMREALEALVAALSDPKMEDVRVRIFYEGHKAAWDARAVLSATTKEGEADGSV